MRAPQHVQAIATREKLNSGRHVGAVRATIELYTRGYHLDLQRLQHLLRLRQILQKQLKCYLMQELQLFLPVLLLLRRLYQSYFLVCLVE